MKIARGFTLIEVLLVVGLFTIILGISIPVISRQTKDASLNQAARNAVQLMRYAQYRAIADRISMGLWLDEGDNSYQVVQYPEQAEEWAPLDGVWAKPVKLEPSVHIDPESDLITFYPDGTTSGGRLILKSASSVAEIHAKPGLGRVEIHIADQKI